MTALKSILDPASPVHTDAASAATTRLAEIGAELAKALAGGAPSTSTAITPAAS